MLARLARSSPAFDDGRGAAAVAGCNEQSIKDFAPKHANQPLPASDPEDMSAKGMQRNAPIMARVFKEEGKVEIWKQKTNGRFDVIADLQHLQVVGASSAPNTPRATARRRKASIRCGRAQMNPNSKYHLAFNIGFPNAYDRANGRTGSNLMVHGACSSSGCYSMTDAQIEEIYAFGRDAFQGGQTEFQIEAFPFRMTAAEHGALPQRPELPFWQMLKEGYDHFEITKVPPKVDVCEKRYVFNRIPEEQKRPSRRPAPARRRRTSPALETAYQSYQSTYQAAFDGAIGKADAPAPKAVDPRHPGGQGGCRLDAQAGARRAHADRAAVDAGRRHGRHDQPHGAHRFRGRPQDGGARCRRGREEAHRRREGRGRGSGEGGQSGGEGGQGTGCRQQAAMPRAAASRAEPSRQRPPRPRSPTRRRPARPACSAACASASATSSEAEAAAIWRAPQPSMTSRGLNCPLPVLKARKRLARMRSRQPALAGDHRPAGGNRHSGLLQRVRAQAGRDARPSTAATGS